MSILNIRALIIYKCFLIRTNKSMIKGAPYLIGSSKCVPSITLLLLSAQLFCYAAVDYLSRRKETEDVSNCVL